MENSAITTADAMRKLIRKRLTIPDWIICSKRKADISFTPDHVNGFNLYLEFNNDEVMITIHNRDEEYPSDHNHFTRHMPHLHKSQISGYCFYHVPYADPECDIKVVNYC